MNNEDKDTRTTKVVRITKKIHALAVKVNRPNHFDEGSWLSFLINKGLEKIKEEKE